MWNTNICNNNVTTMKIAQFEAAALRLSMEPQEVRITHGHVHWMVCHRKGKRQMVVYDEEGRAWASVALPGEEFPDTSAMAIRKTLIRHEEMVLVGFYNCRREPALDLRFD